MPSSQWPPSSLLTVASLLPPPLNIKTQPPTPTILELPAYSFPYHRSSLQQSFHSQPLHALNPPLRLQAPLLVALAATHGVTPAAVGHRPQAAALPTAEARCVHQTDAHISQTDGHSKCLMDTALRMPIHAEKERWFSRLRDGVDTAAQVALRWQLQRGVVVIPKSSSADRLAMNIEQVIVSLGAGGAWWSLWMLGAGRGSWDHGLDRTRGFGLGNKSARVCVCRDTCNGR